MTGGSGYHREQMLAAEMMLVPRDTIPPTVPALRAWLADVDDRGELQVTEGARRVFELFQHPPAGGRVAAGAPADLAARGRHAAAGRARDVRRRGCRRRAQAAMRATLARSAPDDRSCRGGSATSRRTTSGRLRERGVEVVSQVERSRRAAGIRLGPPAA